MIRKQSAHRGSGCPGIVDRICERMVLDYVMMANADREYAYFAMTNKGLAARGMHSLYLGEQATERFLNSLAASGKIKVFYIPEGITEIAAVLPEFASEWP